MLKYLLPVLIILSAGRLAAQPAMGAWSNTGPIPFPINVSGQVHGIGRVSQIKFHPSNPAKVYAVSASGGLFTSTDTGHNWAPTPGSEVLPQTSCSAMCVDYTNDQILYLSLGDANYYSNDYGIYKSTNGGTTWAAANTGIGNRMAVEILMQPTNNQTIVAATNNGIWKSLNGGTSWVQKQAGVFRDMKSKAGAASNVLFAATATTAYYSTDFGDTWTAATGVTAPTGNGGMRLAVSIAAPATVYLAACDGNGVVWKSTNSGASYTQVYSSSTQCITCYDANVGSYSQGDYNFDLNANPTNINELLMVAHCVWRSTDGGQTWSKRTDWYDQMHTDMHHIEWNPYNNNQRWCANDGGVWMSTDPLATTWGTRSDGLAATEIYHAAQSPVVRELVSIGTQDNGELYYTNGIWKTNRGGDWGARNLFDYSLTGTVYYLENGNKRNLLPLGGEVSYNDPIVPTNNSLIDFVKGLPGTSFLSKDSIWRTSDINNPVSTPTWSLLKTSTSPVQAIVSSTADSNILFVVNNANQIFRSKNALAATPAFTTITTPGSTSNTASIATLKSNKAIVFLSCGANVYRSADTGNTWTSITGTGLSGLNIRRIVVDQYSTSERLFVNAGAYVHYKDNTSTAWTNHSANMGLPTVANATDFMVYNNGTAASILRLSTYGRGVWQCDIDANLPPAPDFTADRQIICPGDTVHFSSTVYGNYSSISWSFPGGFPATSTSPSPVVVYNTAGTYAVNFTATGVNGSTTNSKTGFIVVSLGQTAAVQEGFQAPLLPPAGWQLQNTGTSDWTLAGAGGFGASSQSIVFDNYNIDAQGKRAKILAPKVSLTGVTAAQLTFDVAYAPYNTAQPDSLQVRISTDCGHTWTTIYNKTGTVLATAPANTSNIFVPAATEWRTETISLTPYVNNGILLSFENIGHYGQALYIDNVNITPAPLAAFAANDTTICAGSGIVFSDSSINANSWSWSFPGGTPATSTSQIVPVTYATAGTYSVTLTAGNTAGTGIKTKTGYIVVAPLPTVNITATTSLLTAAGTAGSYQWYKNGVLIAGATSAAYHPTANGAYTVVVTGTNGCSATSTAYNYNSTGIRTFASGASIALFPNPSDGAVSIRAEGMTSSQLKVMCYNSAGSLVRNEIIRTANGVAAGSFSWGTLAKGVYNVRLQAGEQDVIDVSLVLR